MVPDKKLDQEVAIPFPYDPVSSSCSFPLTPRETMVKIDLRAVTRTIHLFGATGGGGGVTFYTGLYGCLHCNLLP